MKNLSLFFHNALHVQYRLKMYHLLFPAFRQSESRLTLWIFVEMACFLSDRI